MAFVHAFACQCVLTADLFSGKGKSNCGWRGLGIQPRLTRNATAASGGTVRLLRYSAHFRAFIQGVHRFLVKADSRRALVFSECVIAVEAPTVIYTHTDEAPALATYSFLPILQVRLIRQLFVHNSTRNHVPRSAGWTEKTYRRSRIWNHPPHPGDSLTAEQVSLPRAVPSPP
jgi:hypothetical protein